MALALSLGQRGMGNTWPNPAVGCVIVHKGLIVGRGWTAPSGRPHAEVQALAQAGDAARGATVYVTLEPCPMCAGAIAQSRISHLIFGAWDAKGGAVGSVWDVIRDPRSLYKLYVTAGICESECADLLRDFFEGQR